MTVYNSYIPNNTVLLTDDYTTSPSGTYYAILNPLGVLQGQLQVQRGSNPTVSPVGNDSNTLYATPIPAGQAPGYYAVMQTDGNFVIYASQTGQPPATGAVFATNTAGNGSTVFAQVNDDGSFSLYTGNSPSTVGKMVYTNGVTDPVTSLALTSLNYNLNNIVVTPTGQLSGESLEATNTTSVNQTDTGTLSLSYTKTETFQWSASEAITVGISSTANVGVPGLISGSTTVNVSSTTTISAGESQSATTGETFSALASIVIPPGATYEATLVGQAVTFDVPYTYTGIATYTPGVSGPNAATAPVTGSGTFVGGDGAEFEIVTKCLSGCQGGKPGIIGIVPATSIPEPAYALLLPMALLGTVITRRFRRARYYRR